MMTEFSFPFHLNVQKKQHWHFNDNSFYSVWLNWSNSEYVISVYDFTETLDKLSLIKDTTIVFGGSTQNPNTGGRSTLWKYMRLISAAGQLFWSSSACVHVPPYLLPGERECTEGEAVCFLKYDDSEPEEKFQRSPVISRGIVNAHLNN